jgi:hypothetical protein
MLQQEEQYYSFYKYGNSLVVETVVHVRSRPLIPNRAVTANTIAY